LPGAPQNRILPQIMRPPMPSRNFPKTADNGKFLASAHRLSTFLLAAVSLPVFAKLFIPMDSGWPEALLILTMTASTLIALARQLPSQNIFLAAFGIALIGGAASALGVRTGIPFGPFMFGPAAGQQFFKTLSWAMPLLWVVVILNSRGVARLILRPWRKTRNYGFWLIGFTAGLTALFDVTLEPFASRIQHYWLWMPTKFPVTWQSAPLSDFLGWAFVTLLILAFVTPALINKQLSRRSVPDYHPLAVWLGAILLFGTACALHGIWIAVVVDGIIAIVTAVFAVRGGRW
jgi:uncharacterized membrane protein